MQTVLFTKLFGDRSIPVIADTIAELGFDGVDLLIRDGFSVPASDPAAIRLAVTTFQDRGLAVPLATTDINDAADPRTESVLASCVDAGITTARIGYWKYDPSTSVVEQLDAARRDLDALGEIARHVGIRLALQLHGKTVHSSGALAHTLLDGRGEEFVAYPDPGNQVVQEGREDWRLTFDLLAPWLDVVGVKNGGWYPAGLGSDGQRGWTSDWSGIADGMVPWPQIIAHLKAFGFDGTLTLHSHYELPYEQVLDQTRTDLGHVRRLVGQ